MIDIEELQKQAEEAKTQLKMLQNVLDNLYINENGTKKLRSNVKEKDIQMVADAIFKIKSNFKDILTEIDVMKSREKKNEEKFSKTKQKFLDFTKETGITIPKFFKDLYQIDG